MLKELLSNVAYTTNGALTNKSTGSSLLNFFAQAGSARNKSDAELIQMFDEAYAEDSSAAVVLMFYFRDITQGQGERRLFRVIVKHLAYANPVMARKIIHLIPEFGRWDDVYTFVGTPLETEALQLMKKQWIADLTAEYPSLLAKWLKGSNPKSDEGRYLMRKTYTAFGLTHMQYRKALSKLRARLNVVEKLMSDQDWFRINYSHVPSRAMKLYFRAFLKHDADRFQSYLQDLSSDDPIVQMSVKINAKTLFPHEIVAEILGGPFGTMSLDRSQIQLLNAQWNALPKFPLENTLSIVDTSGSMYSAVGDGKANALSVAIALGIITAQNNVGEFKDSFISFSAKPQFVNLKGKNICEIVQNMSQTEWSQNTNFQAAFELILMVAKRFKLPQEEIPTRLLVISDMQFDAVERTSSYYYRDPVLTQQTNFEAVAEKFKEAGYEMPQLVFWNVCAQVGSNEFPIRKTDNALLLSGYSPVVLKYMYQNELLQPLDLVYEVVNSERYKEVLACLAS